MEANGDSEAFQDLEQKKDTVIKTTTQITTIGD